MEEEIFFKSENIFMHNGNKHIYAVVTMNALFKDKEKIDSSENQWRSGLAIYVPLYKCQDGPFIRTLTDFNNSFTKVELTFKNSPIKVTSVKYMKSCDRYSFNNGLVEIDAADFDISVEIKQ